MTYCPMANADLEKKNRRCDTCPFDESCCQSIVVPEGRYFPVIRDDMVDKAMDFAAMAHKGVSRKASKVPYIVHPVEVVYYVRDIISQLDMDDETASNIIAAAALHDVVEDTSYTADDIRREFGDDIASLVASETEDKMRHRPSSETWRIRKQAFLNHLGDASFGAQIIALADKTANALDLADEREAEGDRMWDKFNEKNPDEHKWYFETIAEILKERLGSTRVYKLYTEALDRIF